MHELAFNCWSSRRSGGNPLLLDPSVRRAVHWAVDEEKLVAAATSGLAVPGTSLLSPAQLGWRWEVPEAGRYRYDPLRAKRILEDAGYADRDGDGVREDAAGRPLSFRLVAFTEHPEHQAAARMIVRWCRDVGIDLRLEVRDEAGFNDDLHSRADFDAVIRSRDGDVDPGSTLGAFTTARIGEGSETRYSDPLYDSLYAAPAGGARPRRPGRHDAPQDHHRRHAEAPLPRRPLHRPLVRGEPAGLPHRRLDGVRAGPEGRGRPLLEPASRHLPGAATAAPGGAGAAGGPAVLPWVVAGVLAAAGAAGAVLWLRRRRKPGMQDDRDSVSRHRHGEDAA